MSSMYKYVVAGHAFAVSLLESYSSEEYLSPYIPFKVEDDSIEPLFTLQLAQAESLRGIGPGKVVKCLNEEAPYFWMFETEEGKYNFGFSYSKNHPDCILVPSDDFKNNTVYVPAGYAERVAEFAISNALMLLYTFNTTPLDTLMVHASVISYNGGAYMFLGKSGTGKSTHSRMWLENIEGTDLLNDDNPVIRVVDGDVYIYGTPWSGKTPCYKNQALPLKGVIRLSQASLNLIRPLPLLQSYASLMPACSCMRWDRRSTDALHKTVEKVISRVRGWHLDCLPDAAAAYVCRSAVASE